MFRRRRSDPVDPLAHVDPALVPPRYARPVADALAARTRWQALVAGARDGVVRDRLVVVGAQVDDGVAAVWATVQRLAEIDRVVATMDADRVVDELKRARRDPAADPAIVQALNDRFVSVQRLQNVIDDADGKLRLLDARLGAAVAKGAELALISGADAPEVGAELGGVVQELEGLRRALDELA